MPSKLFKVLSLIIVTLLFLVQIDQPIALGEFQNRSLSPSKLETEGSHLNPPYRQTLSETDLETEYWEQIFPPQSPDGRYLHGMAYDNDHNAMVLFGGDPDGKGQEDRLSDTWEYESDNWSQVLPERSPPGRVNINNAMVYDQSQDKIVLFGGLSQTGHMNDTWEYYRDGVIRVWEPITPTVKPMVRDTHAMTYDSARERTVMFGGWSPVQPGYYLKDTWEYDGNDWFSITTVISPTARHQHALAYDSQRNVVVLFGGRNEVSTLNDTWEYDGSNWHQVTTVNSPAPRSSHSMAYDPERKVVVLYGGQDGDQDPVDDDTWEYDGTNWIQVNTGVSPVDRYGTPLAYDNQRGKMMFFGGGVKNGNFHTSDETWEYSGWENNHSIYLPIITK